LSARAQHGRVIMRIEDLETPRVKPGFIEKTLDDLLWLGLDWDEGPTLARDALTPENSAYIQSQRRAFYGEIHARLLGATAIYPCVCSRGDLAAAQSAPHEGDAELRYPCTCRGRFASALEAQQVSGKAPAWRVRVADGPVEFDDLLYGRQSIDVQGTIGDFVVAKTPDNPAYQLAVVADDIAMGVTEVVRGDDLIPSTARQIMLYRILGATPPRYGHVPLVVGSDGKRLAKRHGDARIASFRERGVKPERIIGVLARWSGISGAHDAMPRDLIKDWSWEKAARERIILTRERLAEFGAV